MQISRVTHGDPEGYNLNQYGGHSVRKRVITSKESREPTPVDANWLDLEKIVQVELTSEDPGHPIESALLPGNGKEWRAAQPGEQTIRLLFSEPLSIRRIRLEFEELDTERTQQFVLRWSNDGGRNYREIARQQYNFNPVNATDEVEDYQVALDGVDALELILVPDISGRESLASLASLKLA
jgi:hypothetical protein